jgi:DNA polymerase-1
MNDPLLLIDCQCLIYRSFFAIKRMSHEERPMGAVYGFLDQIRRLKEHFGTNRIAFCFDSKVVKRREILPTYKEKRRLENLTPEEQESRASLHEQVALLRDEYLPSIGFRNIYEQEGYEADDLLAEIARRIKSRIVVIVTSDQDMYQCLSPNVRCYSPFPSKTRPQLITRKVFRNIYGLEPAQWIAVKAMAGCTSDEVPGIPGVGEPSAIRYLLGGFKEGSKMIGKVESPEGVEIYKRNLQLVKLPLEKTKIKRKLREDRVSVGKWEAFCDKVGFMATRDSTPIYHG